MRLLGSPIGSESFVDGYIKDTIDTWLHDLDVLCLFAESQPQAAYAVFTHGLFSRWTYFLDPAVSLLSIYLRWMR